MTYAELAAAARGKMGEWCKACPVCDGKACGAHMPGPGSKGSGTMASRNRRAWERYRVVMDTLHEPFEATCSVEALGQELAVPVMIGPLGDVNRHYGPDYDTVTYNDCVLRAARAAGTLAWVGDGIGSFILDEALGVMRELDGAGVPTIKPWSMDTVHAKLDEALAVRPSFVAMDVDAAGLPFLKGNVPPAGAKSVAQLREIAERCHEDGVPFVLKGIMGVRGAEKAVEAGVDGIVVSNHGGRVLDGVTASAEVLPAIADAVGDELTVLVDGGIRTGVDVFRALALGARATLVCRPFVVATYGGGAEGVGAYLAQLAAELRDCMEMCGAQTVADITRDMVAESTWV